MLSNMLLNDEKGFTLVELLITTAIIGIVLPAIGLLLVNVTEIIRFNREKMDLNTASRQITTQIESDLRRAIHLIEISDDEDEIMFLLKDGADNEDITAVRYQFIPEEEQISYWEFDDWDDEFIDDDEKRVNEEFISEIDLEDKDWGNTSRTLGSNLVGNVLFRRMEIIDDDFTDSNQTVRVAIDLEESADEGERYEIRTAFTPGNAILEFID